MPPVLERRHVRYMKKSIVLLAGYPGTGKSYLMDIIKKRYPQFVIVSPDEFKEMMWDRYGFANLKEKEECIEKAWKAYYEAMEKHMKQGVSMLSDYPFSIKQKDRIQELAERYDFQIITIRLIADLDVLYERQRKRDLDPTRHPGHIVGSYHVGMTLHNREEQPCMVPYEEFMNRCKNRGYGTFSLGTLLKEVDVSDFDKVDYTELMQELAEKLQEE